MNVTKLACVEAPRSLNKKRMARSASTTPASSQTACSARKLYAGRSVVTIVVLFSCAACIPFSLTDRRASRLLQMPGSCCYVAEGQARKEAPEGASGVQLINRCRDGRRHRGRRHGHDHLRYPCPYLCLCPCRRRLRRLRRQR